jgi:hypothetical protein
MKTYYSPENASSSRIKFLLSSLYIGLWVSCLLTIFYRNVVGKFEFPMTSFLNAFVTRFGDFYGTYDHWVRLGWGNVDYGLSYFPAAYFVHSIFEFFLFTSQDAMKVIHFVAFSSIFLIIRRFSGLNKRNSILFFILFCTSYPVIFSFSTGNLELLFFTLFIYAFFISETRPVHSAIFLGIAAAPKLVLLIFGLLYFNNKRSVKYSFKLMCITFGSALVTNIAAMILLPKGI